MDHVICQNCNHEVVPRLWSYSPMLIGRLTYLRTQHQCPLCGAVMYESGGGLTIPGTIALTFLIALLGSFIPDLGAIGNAIVSLAGTLVLGFLMLSIVRHSWRSAKRHVNALLGRRSQ